MRALLESEFSIQTVNFTPFETPPTWPKKLEKPTRIHFAEFTQSTDFHVPLSKYLIKWNDQCLGIKSMCCPLETVVR